jgi:hypothetical protein
MNGTKHDTEAAGLRKQAVGERCAIERRGTATSPGRSTSDHAGTSNDKTGENPVRRKPKVSWGR